MEVLKRCRQRKLINQHAGVNTFCEDLLTCEKFRVSTEKNVDTATRHVGGNSDRTKTTCLSNNLRLTRMLLGIQHFMANSALGEFTRQILALLNTDCSDKDWLPDGVALCDVFHHCAKLCYL